jgi:hypothetical protein
MKVLDRAKIFEQSRRACPEPVERGRLKIAQDETLGKINKNDQSRRACPDPVERGGLKIAQDEILGRINKNDQSRQGRLRMAQDEILGALESDAKARYLTSDVISLLAFLVAFSRPLVCGFQ